jgi:hypothetical protein
MLRAAARDWIDANESAVSKIMRSVAEAEDDEQVALGSVDARHARSVRSPR